MRKHKAFSMNHWKTIPYKQIDNFRDFYYEDKSNIAYYSDWDRILRYHKATGYDGIEIAPWDVADILKLLVLQRILQILLRTMESLSAECSTARTIPSWPINTTKCLRQEKPPLICARPLAAST